MDIDLPKFHVCTQKFKLSSLSNASINSYPQSMCTVNPKHKECPKPSNPTNQEQNSWTNKLRPNSMSESCKNETTLEWHHLTPQLPTHPCVNINNPHSRRRATKLSHSSWFEKPISKDPILSPKVRSIWGGILNPKFLKSVPLIEIHPYNYIFILLETEGQNAKANTTCINKHQEKRAHSEGRRDPSHWNPPHPRRFASEFGKFFKP